MARQVCPGLIAILLVAAGCSSIAPAGNSPRKTSLKIGVGGGASASAGINAGLDAIIANLTEESLILFDQDGRPRPNLVEKWRSSPDGLQLTLSFRSASFHDGAPLTAGIVKPVLDRRLRLTLGLSADDVIETRVDSDNELTIALKRRNNFLLEAMDMTIVRPGSDLVGTSAFKVGSPDQPTHLVANTSYAAGIPGLTAIDLKRYDSVRAAWADLLRGNVDMLYEVGVDALDSLEPSSRVKVFSYRRHYQLVGLFNTRTPTLRDPVLRRKMNVAIDRATLISEALGGRATQSSGPIWPDHWALPAGQSSPLPYEPERLADPGQPLVLRCLVADRTFERVAIGLQRQLQSVGIRLDLQMPPAAELIQRLESGDFDIALIEVVSAPNLLRPSLFWTSKAPYNYGGYSSPAVDAAFDSIRQAPDDDGYRKGVGDLQQAIVADPPAIFLAWTERARAVSTSFQVPVEPGRDPLSTLRLWRPVGSAPATN